MHGRELNQLMVYSSPKAYKALKVLCTLSISGTVGNFLTADDLQNQDAEAENIRFYRELTVQYILRSHITPALQQHSIGISKKN